MVALVNQVESMNDEKVRQLIESSLQKLEVDKTFLGKNDKMSQAILKINQNGNKMSDVMELIYTT